MLQHGFSDTLFAPTNTETLMENAVIFRPDPSLGSPMCTRSDAKKGELGLRREWQGSGPTANPAGL